MIIIFRSNNIVFAMYINHINLDFCSVACVCDTDNYKVRVIFYCLKCAVFDLERPGFKFENMIWSNSDAYLNDSLDTWVSLLYWQRR